MTTTQTHAHEDIEALLAERDAALGVRWRSLCPGRELARPLRELIPDRALPSDLRLAAARGIATIAEAVHRNFPDNLFCDLELVLARLERGGATHGVAWVDATVSTVVDLHDLFGHGTSIQFRYVHDFLYGFDWARWVRRDPETRRVIGPFDPGFLAYARRRGAELVELIAQDDDKYHRIPRGRDRNPFAFQRDPASETRLLSDLAVRGWVPVEAWKRDAAPRWDRDYTYERERRARELGLTIG
ncbi:hypothetical protein [Sandaracinus amylolyticus]|uniref:Ferrochelatase n=1 Tax=Sandaracinus amylolyticus TaxID=927083 RepID=A0A0F6SG35_9BACT|nr:hypothetical protein [Sandaracinus amylolyticus]AKF08004.1 hypothetical protein DB32_005153 [Sandaracinus amylolyticus]